MDIVDDHLKLVQFPDGFNPQDFPFVPAVFGLAEQRGQEIYLVGGFLRDALGPVSRRQCAPRDFDFAVLGGQAIELATFVAESLKAHFVLLDAANDIARVVLSQAHGEYHGVYLDFAGASPSLEEDLARRDFTVNAFAYHPSQPDKIIDLYDGLEDLQARLIRTRCLSIMEDDPLRVLRAYRFAALLGGKVEATTREYLSLALPLLADVARERVSYELFACFNNHCANLIYEMGEVGLLEAIFPELTECRRVTANSFHHLALFDHSMETIPQVEKAYESFPDWAREFLAGELAQGVSRLSACKVACLLHDIGKPATWQITEEGRHTFIAHDKVGAELIKPLALRMKWSKTVSRYIEKLVLYHLRPGALFHQGEPTVKAVNRLYRSCGEDFPALMFLSFGDLGATCGSGLTDEARARLEVSFRGLLEGYLAFSQEEKTLPKLLDGKAVMALLELPPCPQVGVILEELVQAQLAGDVCDRQAAEAFVLKKKNEL